MKSLIHKYEMELFSLERHDFVPQQNVSIKGTTLIYVDRNNIVLAKNDTCCALKYKKFARMVCNGAVGIFAVYSGKIVGYGWLKSKGIKDHFYRFGKNVAYLSEFFVMPDFRGKGIYPAMISALIEQAVSCPKFYISAYVSNTASRNGLKKWALACYQGIAFTVFAR